MWGNSSADASYQNNFNVGFSTTRSDVLVHLAQWQYWWWFWFSFLWCFYYLVILRTVKQRALKMRPKIHTSQRPHSKWGDFLACIVPTIWCVNILTNSNLILRLIEWQNESSLFTIRIRGRQWYWIYKFDLKNFTDILTAPKNVGTNRWVVSTFGDLQTADDYLHVLQLRAQSRWVRNYWQENLLRGAKPENHHLVSSIEQFRMHCGKHNSLASFVDSVDLFALNNQIGVQTRLIPNSLVEIGASYTQSQNIGGGLFKGFDHDVQVLDTLVLKTPNLDIFESLVSPKSTQLFKNPDLVETSRWIKRGLGVHSPLRIIKTNPDLIVDTQIRSNHYSEDDILSIRFGSGENNIESKPLPHSKYLTFKQQRSKKKKIAPIQKTFKTHEYGDVVTTRYSGHQILTTDKVISSNELDPNVQYKLFSRNRNRSELVPVTLTKRLLRTKRVLVVPAHTNITAITNSYDVVHSWFIPGLGLKLDCVPGRSTHHTFFVDSVGFYYGQCAEICGRYHHHMPIRLCALPFEHFLVWWQSFGMSKLLFTNSQKKYSKTYAFRQYVW